MILAHSRCCVACTGSMFRSIRPRLLSLNRSSLLLFASYETTIAKCPRNYHQRHHCYHLLALINKHQSTRKAIQQVHAHLVTTGFTLLLIYRSSAYILLVCNALFRFYSLGSYPNEAIMFFRQLQHFSSASLHSFDSFTYSFLLKSCTNLDSAVGGSQLHVLTLKLGFECHVYVQTALVNMYISCGSSREAIRIFYEMPGKNHVTWNVIVTGLTRRGELGLARSLFEEMPAQTIVSWTGIIDGYTRMNRPKEALALFQRMVTMEGLKPNEITMLAIFPAISSLGALETCQVVHAYGEKSGFCVFDIRFMNSLIDAYSKCGCVGSASRVFEDVSPESRNLVSWTSMISAFAMHGMAKEAVTYFEGMERADFLPNRVTFLSVLSACSHGGLIEEGLNFFLKMTKQFHIFPDVKHYGCIIDMLGRAGRLEEAERMALEVPDKVMNAVIWRTLLGSCSFYGKIRMAERVAKRVLDMERCYGGDYVLLSNIFNGASRFGDAEKVRSLLDKSGASKVPGCSLV